MFDDISPSIFLEYNTKASTTKHINLVLCELPIDLQLEEQQEGNIMEGNFLPSDGLNL